MKAILFDCYGVLVGTGAWAIYERLGGNVEEDAELLDMWLNKLNSGSVSSTEFNEAMGQALQITPAEYAQAVKEDEKLNQPLLQYIREELAPHLKLAVVSNAAGASLRKQLTSNDLEVFDGVFISEEVGLLKPDPKFFEFALEKLGVNAQEAVFVDDHQKYLDGAQSVGLQTILYTDFTNLKSQLGLLISEK